MKKFYLKCAFIFLFAALYLGKKFIPAYHYDPFNVFHWNDIRFINSESNKNYIKSKYILKNPKKFNAFIFGSSRVQSLPPDMLPKQLNGKVLSWYNMTSAAAIPNNHLSAIKVFLKNKIPIEFVVLGFDSICMYSSPEYHKYDIMRCEYQIIAEQPLKYLMAYLNLDIDENIKKSVDEYNKEEHLEESKLFYKYGGRSYSPELTENIDLQRYEIKNNEITQVDTYKRNLEPKVALLSKEGLDLKSSYKDLEAIVDLCAQNGIKLILFTNPMYQTLYRGSVDNGYFEFLRKAAQRCEFYNFSTLNNYTTDPRYYFEYSHYRSALGLIIEKYLFGSEENREQIRRDAGDELFGVKVNAQNIDAVIEGLEKQIRNYAK